jgi:hypothetical protein
MLDDRNPSIRSSIGLAHSGLFLVQRFFARLRSHRISSQKQKTGGSRTPAELEEIPELGHRIRRVDAKTHKASRLYVEAKQSQEKSIRKNAEFSECKAFLLLPPPRQILCNLFQCNSCFHR